MQKITLGDVFEITNRIEVKLDRLGERVSVLELWKAEIVGKLTLIVGIFSVSLTLFVDWIRKRINI